MKDKNLAGILALIFGMFGIHRFYLGQIGLGILYIILGPIGLLLGLIDAIVLFSMDDHQFNIKYNRNYYTTKRKDTDFDRREYRYRDQEREREKERARRRYAERKKRPEYTNRRPRRKPTSKKKVSPKTNPYKTAGIRKFKDYDYDGAIQDFIKALEISPKDIAIHFNLACAYSLNENIQKSFEHLDKAVAYGFDDFKRIKEHDALSFLRVQDQFEQFEQNGFQLIQKLEAPKEDMLQGDLLEQLKKLGTLREKGLLSEEEFSAQKKKLLG